MGFAQTHVRHNKTAQSHYCFDLYKKRLSHFSESLFYIAVLFKL